MWSFVGPAAVGPRRQPRGLLERHGRRRRVVVGDGAAAGRGAHRRRVAAVRRLLGLASGCSCPESSGRARPRLRAATRTRSSSARIRAGVDACVRGGGGGVDRGRGRRVAARRAARRDRTGRRRCLGARVRLGAQRVEALPGLASRPGDALAAEIHARRLFQQIDRLALQREQPGAMRVRGALAGVCVAALPITYRGATTQQAMSARRRRSTTDLGRGPRAESRRPRWRRVDGGITGTSASFWPTLRDAAQRRSATSTRSPSCAAVKLVAFDVGDQLAAADR